MDVIDKKAVGQRIKDIRLKLGLTMEDFIERIDGKPGQGRSGTVNNWETGKNAPNAKRLKKIAELGEVSVDFILNGSHINEMENTVLKIITDSYTEYTEYQTLSTGDKYSVANSIDRYLETNQLVDSSTIGGTDLYDGFINEETGTALPELYSFFKKNIPLFTNSNFILSLDSLGAFYKSSNGFEGNEEIIIPRFCIELDKLTYKTSSSDFASKYPLYTTFSDTFYSSYHNIGTMLIDGKTEQAKDEIEKLIKQLKDFCKYKL